MSGTLDPEVQEKLIHATSFRPVGFQYTKAFKNGRSDGRIKLYKHSKFPAGLVGRVINVLDAHDVPYHLDAEVAADTKPDLDPSYDLVDIESREYQDRAVEKGLLNPRGVIRAPTGSGKTAIATRLIVARNKWALVVVPTIDLLHQYKRFLEDHVRVPWADVAPKIGQLGDGVVDPQPITVGTVRTVANAMGVAYETYEFGEYDDRDDTDVSPSALRGWIEKIGTLVVDEAHILGAQTVYDIATGIPAPNKYGFSASPWRDDGADLMIEAATGPPIYRIGTEVLVQDGFLVPPIIRVVNTRSWWVPPAYGMVCMRCGAQRERTPKGLYVKKCTECNSERFRSEYTQAYGAEIVENAIRNGNIAAMVREQLPGPHLVLVKQIKHGRLLKDLMPGAVFLSGKNDGAERAEVYDRVRNGTLTTVIATTIADLGLDVPALRTLVLAGGGKSSTRHLQRIGRVVRAYEDKTHALVVDFDDGHIHKWFREHARDRRKIEKAEWGETALWM